MKRCNDCGKEYIKFENWEVLPVGIRGNIPEYIPNCECSVKKAYEKAENKRLQDIKDNRQKTINKLKEISITDKKFFECRFETSDKDIHIGVAERYANSFLTKNTDVGLILSGTVGNGKTHAAACIANKLMESGKTVLALSMIGYLNKLKGEWIEAEKDIINKVKSVDLLIIDDFGTEKATEWVLEKVFNLIDTRYRAKKPLLITTNLTKEQMKERLGSRIADRINEMCFNIEVQGESKRGKDTASKFTDFLSA